MLIGWFKLKGFECTGTAVKMGRGMPDLYTDRHDEAGLQGLSNCEEQDKGEGGKLQLLVL